MNVEQINMDKKIAYSNVKNFFDSRACDAQGVNSTMLQKDPNIASERDMAEKEILLSLTYDVQVNDVLDLGCGNGRLADLFKNVENYVGVDFSENLVKLASERGLGTQYKFYVSSVTELHKIENICETQYDFIVISGLLIYLNDEDVSKLIQQILTLCNEECRIYLREPVSVLNEKLSLIDHYSQELGTYYNAVYRTEAELLNFLNPLIVNGFKVAKRDYMYKDLKLNNRAETIQKYFYLERIR
jgi:SAM-dependent methyltransferase